MQSQILLRIFSYKKTLHYVPVLWSVRCKVIYLGFAVPTVSIYILKFIYYQSLWFCCIVFRTQLQFLLQPYKRLDNHQTRNLHSSVCFIPNRQASHCNPFYSNPRQTSPSCACICANANAKGIWVVRWLAMKGRKDRGPITNWRLDSFSGTFVKHLGTWQSRFKMPAPSKISISGKNGTWIEKPVFHPYCDAGLLVTLMV